MDPKEYINTIKESGRLLQIIRDEELEAADHPAEAIASLSESFRFAVKTQPAPATSGLVELQFYLKGMKR